MKQLEEKVIKLVNASIPNMWACFKVGVLSACDMCDKKRGRQKRDKRGWN